ncbi:MAG: hypothetical protein VB137_03805 [Burkholderia sp.]
MFGTHHAQLAAQAGPAAANAVLGLRGAACEAAAEIVAPPCTPACLRATIVPTRRRASRCYTIRRRCYM